MNIPACFHQYADTLLFEPGFHFVPCYFLPCLARSEVENLCFNVPKPGIVLIKRRVTGVDMTRGVDMCAAVRADAQAPYFAAIRFKRRRSLHFGLGMPGEIDRRCFA